MTAADRAADLVPTWVRQEPARLLAFARAAALPTGGFGWLADDGTPREDRPVETWVNCRMTHVFALATLQGRADALELVDHGLATLRGRLHDAEYGGWFAADPDGAADAGKRAYEHAFVVLAAASATAAGARGAESLLADALDVVERRFWDEDEGLVVDVWDRSWEELEDYRGINANMHSVEAFLAAGDVTNDRGWTDRAARVVERVVDRFAREHDWRLPEHFDRQWNARLDYNRADPAHQFRPYGVTIGHLMEWARLALQVRHAQGLDAPSWLLEGARALFDRAVGDGWDVDGAEGFVYTADFDGRPVVRGRLHWVVTEAIATAWTLHRVTGQDTYGDWFRRWCDHADRLFVDRELGSWHHELDSDNRPAATVWAGKPDVYHAYQATLLPQLPLSTSFVAAIRANTLEG